MADTLKVGSSTAIRVDADAADRKLVTTHGSTVYYGSSGVTSSSNDGNVTDGNAVTISKATWFVSAGSTQLVVDEVEDVAAEDISIADDLTVAGDLAVTGTTTLTGAQTLTGATTHAAGITGTHADGLVLSANGGKDTLALSNTTADVGLTIGADTNLYRSAANTLKTDDALTVTGVSTLAAATATTIGATGGITGSHADGLVLSANGGKDTLALSDTTADVGLTIGADTNLYRSAANTLSTDDKFLAGDHVFGKLGASGQTGIGALGPASQPAVLFGTEEDTNLYRSAANTLKTDDALTVTGATVLSSTVAITGAVTANGGATLADATDIAVGSTTGTKIGTATSQKIGFYNVTPVVQPTAYTQTYATATKTHSNPTASAVATTGAALAAYGYAEAQANALVAAVNALIIDDVNIKSVLNQVVDDLQALGLLS